MPESARGSGKHDNEPADPEEIAEAAGADPSLDEIDEYRERIGDPPPEPPD